MFAWVYAATHSLALASYFATLLKLIFSPTFAVKFLQCSSIVKFSNFAFKTSSRVLNFKLTKNDCSLLANSENNLLLATKSVSEFNSNKIAIFLST
jgi:hypothetical protein